MAKKKFSDLPATTSIGASDLLATSQVDADAQSGYTSKKITGGNVARSINAGIEYPTDLETEDKTIIGAINEINSNALAIDSASGDIASFDTAISAPFVSLSTTIVAKGGNGTPQQEKPIVGYSEANQTRCGKQLWNEQYEVGQYNPSDGQPMSANNAIRNKDYIPIPAGTSFALLFPAGISGRIFFFDSNKTMVSTEGIGSGITVKTMPSGCYYLRFHTSTSYGETYHNDIAVLYPSTETQYEPFNGQKITLALGQTVYGGRLYFENGWKYDVTHGYLYSNSSSGWTIGAQYGTSRRFNYEKSDIKPQSQALCNMFPYGEVANDREIVSIHDSVNMAIVLIHSDRLPTDDLVGWNTFLSNNPIEICYQLATPFTIDLSSSDMLDAVVGKNNVFSDCGVTSLTFIDKIQHYVDKKIAELQALILQ